MAFWGELKRRNVVKVAVAYAIVAWLLIEIASTVFPLLQLPDWTATFVAVLLIMGFPMALILSWAYELTPEGMKRSHEVDVSESITHVTGRKIDFAIIGALVLALGFVVVDNYLLEDGEMVGGVLPNSVAVLPFENLSLDPEDAFFASGIHEEVLNHLAKLQSLNVISRTSVVRGACPGLQRSCVRYSLWGLSTEDANDRSRMRTFRHLPRHAAEESRPGTCYGKTVCPRSESGG